MTQETNIPQETAAALILLSRPTLTGEDLARARAAAEGVSDWTGLADIALRKFSLPMVYANLSTLNTDDRFAPALELMQALSVPMTMRTLSVMATQLRFHQTCIAGTGVPHAYLKGPSLAQRYYPDAGLRYCRDIDVLVADAQYETIVRGAVAAGYQVWMDPSQDLSEVSERALRAILHYEHAITLVTEDGVTIEVHRDIDKSSGIFEPERILARAEPMDFQGTQLNVLPTPLLFSYICYHNTRHTWSRLHWLADLHAIADHAEFDEAAALDCADQYGVGPTVRACLEMKAISRMPERWARETASSRGGQMLDLCIRNLGGDLELEYQIRAGYGLLGLPFDWMIAPGLRRRILRRHLAARLKPNYAQYVALPLPEPLQWLYYFTRPLSSLKRRLMGPDGRA